MAENPKNHDLAMYQEHGLALVRAVDESIISWLNHKTSIILGTDALEKHGPEITAAISEVAANARESLTELALGDVDAPMSGPLERIRQAMGPVHAALDGAGAPRPSRDRLDSQMRPDDIYGLGPYTFLDLGESVHEAGITWGAAKAYVHTQRRRS